MKKICDLDIDIFACVAPNITASEVIITDERIQHIKDHHPGHFEMLEPFLEAAITSPDYILKDVPSTGLILKSVQEGSLRFQMVLRVHTASDSPCFKNSIISAWRISESRWNNYLRSKKILYKSE